MHNFKFLQYLPYITEILNDTFTIFENTKFHSYLNAYQLSIEIDKRWPGTIKNSDYDIGGAGKNLSVSFSQLLAKNLSQCIKNSSVYIQGAFLHTKKNNLWSKYTFDYQFNNPPEIISCSNIGQSDISIYKYKSNPFSYPNNSINNQFSTLFQNYNLQNSIESYLNNLQYFNQRYQKHHLGRPALTSAQIYILNKFTFDTIASKLSINLSQLLLLIENELLANFSNKTNLFECSKLSHLNVLSFEYNSYANGIKLSENLTQNTTIFRSLAT